MGESIWKTTAVQLTGRSHLRDFSACQDAWFAFDFPCGVGGVVSDGVGSLRDSDWAAKEVCRSVAHIAKQITRYDEIAIDDFLDAVRDDYVARLAGYETGTLAATCLLALIAGTGTVHVALCGDGLAAILKTSGEIEYAVDAKSNSFSNQVKPLSQKTKRQDWVVASCAASECRAVFLMTDGVSETIPFENRDSFLLYLANSRDSLSEASFKAQLRNALCASLGRLSDDDKTLLIISRKEMEAQ